MARGACPCEAAEPALYSAGFRGETSRAREIGSSPLTAREAESIMGVGATARRPARPEPRAAEFHWSVQSQGRVAGAGAPPAHPEVWTAETFSADNPRDLRERAPRPEGGLLQAAVRSAPPPV